MMQTLTFNNHDHKNIFSMMMNDPEWIEYLTTRLVNRDNSEDPLEVFASIFKKQFKQYKSFNVTFGRHITTGSVAQRLLRANFDVLCTQGTITGSGPDLTNFKLRYL